MKDWLIALWMILLFSFMVTLAAFVSAYDMFGSVLLTNIDYFAAAYGITAFAFFVFTLIIVAQPND